MTRGQFLPHSKKIANLLKKVCKKDVIQKRVCLKLFIFYACGKDPVSFDEVIKIISKKPIRSNRMKLI